MITPRRPEIAVGGIVVVDNHLLLVERGRPPAVGQWSVPGGRLEWGEAMEVAVVREVREETGLETVCGEFVGWVERSSADTHFVILDFMARPVSESHGLPELEAADDAADAAWVPLDELEKLPLVEGLIVFLDQHQIRA